MEGLAPRDPLHQGSADRHPRTREAPARRHAGACAATVYFDLVQVCVLVPENRAPYFDRPDMPFRIPSMRSIDSVAPLVAPVER